MTETDLKYQYCDELCWEETFQAFPFYEANFLVKTLHHIQKHMNNYFFLQYFPKPISLGAGSFSKNY